MTDISHDPAHWQKRSDEMRAAAKETTDADAKEALLKFAADYDRLADLALKRAHGKFPETLPY